MRGAFIAFVRSRGLLAEAGEYLTYLAEVAFRLRRWPELGSVAGLLTTLPSDAYQNKGRFYEAYYVSAITNHTSDQPFKLLENVYDTGPDDFRARSLLGIASFHLNRKELDLAFEFYRSAFEAAHSAHDPVSATLSMKMIGVIESMTGSPKDVIKIYERLLEDGQVREQRPDVYIDLANSYAFDLAETGRVKEAYEVAKKLAESPYARVFGEVLVTLGEIEAKLPVGKVSRFTRYPNSRLFDPKYNRAATEDDMRLGAGFREAPSLPSVEEQHSLLVSWLVSHEPGRITSRTYKTLSAMHAAYVRNEPTEPSR